MEEEIYRHKKELIMCICCFVIGVIIGIILLVTQGTPDGSIAVKAVGTVLILILSGFVIGGIPIGWIKLPPLPFLLGGSTEYAFMGMLLNLIYHILGAVLLGWLLMAVYLIRDIIFLVRHKQN